MNAFNSNVAVWTEKHSGKGVRPHLWFNEEYLVILGSYGRAITGQSRPCTHCKSTAMKVSKASGRVANEERRPRGRRLNSFTHGG